MTTKPWVRKLLITLVSLAVFSCVASVVGVVGVIWWYGRGVDDLDEDRLRNYQPSQVTRVFARDGELIGEFYKQRRTLISYDEIPSHVENAFLAAEDADFYHHEGMDYMGMARALVTNVRAGKIKQGAPTITQQVVKIFLLTPERTFERKVEELVLARRVEQAFEKREILQLYLNEIYLGHGRYGIEEASRFYFAKSVRDIDLGQAALLATLPKAPGRDSPLRRPEKAKARQVYVLGQMIKNGFCTPAEAARFVEGPLDLASAEQRDAIVPGAEEFLGVVRKRLVAHYGEEAIDTLGAQVHTTVSMKLQRATRQGALEGLQAIDDRHDYARKLAPADAKWISKTQAELDKLARLESKGRWKFSPGVRVPGTIVAAAPELPADGFAVRVGEREVFVRVPPGSRYDLKDQTLPQQFPKAAIVHVRITRAPNSSDKDGVPAGWWVGEVDAGPRSAVVVLDVRTGEVLSMVSGDHYDRAQFNLVMQARRQPGSSFKPFVYGSALLTKKYSPASIVVDSPEIYAKWRPTNYARDRYLGEIRMRTALKKSVNTVAIKLADDVGVSKVQAFARAAGIESKLPNDLPLALGSGEVRPFELARAYLTLARGGERVEPGFIREVKARGGAGWIPERESKRVLPEDVVFVLTSMMESVVRSGTATKAKKLGRPVAGKTGTSNDNADAWFAGFTKRRVAITWVGFDTQRTSIGRGETGGKAALPIWLSAMKAAVVGEPKPFTPPESVSVRRIDAASGLLVPTGSAAADYQGKAIEEYFVAGTEPVDEAVPAALPSGDVLLGLYEDEDEDEDELGEGHTATAVVGPGGTAPVAPPAVGLPSLGDEL